MKPTNQGRVIVTAAVVLLAVISCLCTLGAAGVEAMPPEPAGRVAEPTCSPAPEANHGAVRDAVASPSPKGGFYCAPLNTELRFRYSAKSATLVGSHREAEPVRVQCDLHGELVVAVVARQRDDLVIEVSLPATTAVVGGAAVDGPATQQLVEDLAMPTLVHMRDDGTVLGLRFAEGTHEETFNWLRSLVAAARFVVRGDRREWSCDEVDTAGVAEVRYRWEQALAPGAPGILVKEKAGCRGMSGQLPPAAASDTSAGQGAEVHGEGRATLDAALGWFTKVEFGETARLDLPDAGAFIESSFAVEFRLESAGRRSELPTVAIDGSWDTLDGRDTARACSQRQSDASLAAELANVSSPDVLRALDGSVQAAEVGSPDQARLIGQLAALVRLRPEVIGELRGLLATGGWRRETLDLALVAIAQAGTEAAQAMLAELMGDARVDPVLRLASIRSVFAIEHPDDAVTTRLAMQAYEAGDNVMCNGSLLAFGCVAGRVDAEHRASAIVELVRLETAAAQRNDLGTWFEALGNAGLVESLSLIESYRRSTDECQRAACLVSLRRVSDRAAFEALEQAATSDPALTVRTRALEVLVERGSRDSIGVFERAIARETDRDALRAALRGLAGHAEDQAVRQVLQGIAATHACAEARGWAQQVLAAGH